MRWKAVCLLTLLAGCSLEPDLPKLPERDLLPIQSRVDRRYEDVLARPSSAAANGALGMTLHSFLDNPHAEVLYHRAFLLEPSSFNWLYYIGVTQAAQEKYDPAAASLRHALSLRPDYLPAKLLLAKVTFRMGNLVESEALAGELAAVPETAAYGAFWTARVASQRENHGAAAEACRKACDEFPAFGDAHSLWARSARRMGQDEIAKEHFLLADEYRFRTPSLADPLLEEVHGERHHVSHRLLEGLVAELQGRNADARKSYTEALAMEPQSSAAHARLIRICLDLGNRPKALEHYTATRRLDDQPADAHANYGLLLFQEDRFQEAESAFELALQINPYHPDALAYLGRLREQNKDFQEADRLYRTAIDARPSFREARLFLGGLLTRQRRYKEAYAQFDKLLELEDEKTARFLLEVSHFYTAANDRRATVECLRRAYEVAERFGQSELLDEMARMGYGR